MKGTARRSWIFAVLVLTGCASEPEIDVPAVKLPPADPLTAAIREVCLPALLDTSKLQHFATQAGFRWINLSKMGRGSAGYANGVSVSQVEDGGCRIAFETAGEPSPLLLENLRATASKLSFEDGAPLRETRAPNGQAIFSCRDTLRRSLMVVMAPASAIPETLKMGDTSFTALGGPQLMTNFRIFLLDQDCAEMEEGVADSAVKPN